MRDHSDKVRDRDFNPGIVGLIADPDEIDAPTEAMPATEEMAAVEQVIDEMRPAFRADGGDVDLVDVSGDLILVHLTGTCAGCRLATMTLGGVQARITETLGRPVRVVPVQRV